MITFLLALVLSALWFCCSLRGLSLFPRKLPKYFSTFSGSTVVQTTFKLWLFQQSGQSNRQQFSRERGVKAKIQKLWSSRMADNKGVSERSFIMIKPDGVQRGLIGEITKRFEQKGFHLVAMKLTWPGMKLLEEHYKDLADKPFFNSLVQYMDSGPVVAMVWQGLNVVKTGRQMLGETNPANSLPGTIRGDFCIQVGRNIIHGSDSVEAAEREINLWFNESELYNWKSIETACLYE